MFFFHTNKDSFHANQDVMFYFILSSLHMFIPLGVINILIPKVRTESAKKGTFNTGAQAFNNLPLHLKRVDSVVIFKTQLNDIIFRVLVNLLDFFYLVI